MESAGSAASLPLRAAGPVSQPLHGVKREPEGHGVTWGSADIQNSDAVFNGQLSPLGALSNPLGALTTPPPRLLDFSPGNSSGYCSGSDDVEYNASKTSASLATSTGAGLMIETPSIDDAPTATFSFSPPLDIDCCMDDATDMIRGGSGGGFVSDEDYAIFADIKLEGAAEAMLLDDWFCAAGVTGDMDCLGMSVTTRRAAMSEACQEMDDEETTYDHLLRVRRRSSMELDQGMIQTYDAQENGGFDELVNVENFLMEVSNEYTGFGLRAEGCCLDRTIRLDEALRCLAEDDLLSARDEALWSLGNEKGKFDSDVDPYGSAWSSVLARQVSYDVMSCDVIDRPRRDANGNFGQTLSQLNGADDVITAHDILLDDVIDGNAIFDDVIGAQYSSLLDDVTNGSLLAEVAGDALLGDVINNEGRDLQTNTGGETPFDDVIFLGRDLPRPRSKAHAFRRSNSMGGVCGEGGIMKIDARQSWNGSRSRASPGCHTSSLLYEAMSGGTYASSQTNTNDDCLQGRLSGVKRSATSPSSSFARSSVSRSDDNINKTSTNSSKPTSNNATGITACSAASSSSAAVGESVRAAGMLFLEDHRYSSRRRSGDGAVESRPPSKDSRPGGSLLGSGGASWSSSRGRGPATGQGGASSGGVQPAGGLSPSVLEMFLRSRHLFNPNRGSDALLKNAGKPSTLPTRPLGGIATKHSVPAGAVMRAVHSCKQDPNARQTLRGPEAARMQEVRDSGPGSACVATCRRSEEFVGGMTHTTVPSLGISVSGTTSSRVSNDSDLYGPSSWLLHRLLTGQVDERTLTSRADVTKLNNTNENSIVTGSRLRGRLVAANIPVTKEGGTEEREGNDRFDYDLLFNSGDPASDEEFRLAHLDIDVHQLMMGEELEAGGEPAGQRDSNGKANAPLGGRNGRTGQSASNVDGVNSNVGVATDETDRDDDERETWFLRYFDNLF